MQYPVGMEFDPAQMRNVMDNFGDVVLSPVAIHKFFHAVLSGWVLAGIFVIGVSSWFLLRRRATAMAISSIKVGGWVAFAGILGTLWSGDGSAVDVARVQPMKLAAMEGLYDGNRDQSIVAFGLLNPAKTPQNDEDEFLFAIKIPYGLSFLATHDPHAFVPGINNLIDGVIINEAGDTARVDSYADRIAIGKRAHEALRAYDTASAAMNTAAMDSARSVLMDNYRYFGYGYLDSPYEAVPPVAVTFYAFHAMVLIGGYLFLFILLVVWAAYRRPALFDKKWLLWLGIISVPLVWVCSEAGWVTAEVGRQPWIIEGLMPVRAAISDISAATVQTTFWLFALVFTAFLAAEVCIMLRSIDKGSRTDYENYKD